MNNTIKRVIGILIVFSLAFLTGCKHTEPLVVQDDVVNVYEDNVEMFDEVVNCLLEDDIYNDIGKYSFFYEDETISVKYKNEEIVYVLPEDVHTKLLECFGLLESIVNDSYKTTEYEMVACIDQNCRGVYFCIYDKEIEYGYFLNYTTNPEVCLESAPSWAYQINDNWFYWGVGQV